MLAQQPPPSYIAWLMPRMRRAMGQSAAPDRPFAEPPKGSRVGLPLFTRNPRRRPMADESSLRFIGMSLGAVTAAVTLIAAMLVVNVDRSAFERPATTAAVVESAG
jgi:hypothetical protein